MPCRCTSWLASPYACTTARDAPLCVRCFALILQLSRAVLPLVPHAVAEPSEEQVAALLARFISEMQALFERHKTKAGYPDLTLVVL
jgi:hypothetical protein